MLSASILAKSDRLLTVDYTMRNERSSDLFVFTLLFRFTESGEQSTDQHLAYVASLGATSALIGKYLCQVPAGMKVESPEIPLLRRLRPSEQINGQIALRIPLAKHLPYVASPISRNATGNVDRIFIRIGFLDSSRFKPGMAIVELAPEQQPNTFVCDYGLGLEFQEFAEVELPGLAEGIGTFFIR